MLSGHATNDPSRSNRQRLHNPAQEIHAPHIAMLAGQIAQGMAAPLWTTPRATFVRTTFHQRATLEQLPCLVYAMGPDLHVA